MKKKNDWLNLKWLVCSQSADTLCICLFQSFVVVVVVFWMVSGVKMSQWGKNGMTSCLLLLFLYIITFSYSKWDQIGLRVACKHRQKHCVQWIMTYYQWCCHTQSFSTFENPLLLTLSTCKGCSHLLFILKSIVVCHRYMFCFKRAVQQNPFPVMISDCMVIDNWMNGLTSPIWQCKVWDALIKHGFLWYVSDVQFLFHVSEIKCIFTACGGVLNDFFFFSTWSYWTSSRWASPLKISFYLLAGGGQLLLGQTWKVPRGHVEGGGGGMIQ